jgi:hypothetical protein
MRQSAIAFLLGLLRNELLNSYQISLELYLQLDVNGINFLDNIDRPSILGISHISVCSLYQELLNGSRVREMLGRLNCQVQGSISDVVLRVHIHSPG